LSLSPEPPLQEPPEKEPFFFNKILIAIPEKESANKKTTSKANLKYIILQ